MDARDPKSLKKQTSVESSRQSQVPSLADVLNENEKLRHELERFRKENDILRAEIAKLKSQTTIEAAPNATNDSREPLTNRSASQSKSATTLSCDSNTDLQKGETSAPASETNKTALTNNDKVRLFQRLFCGREDVFAERWQTKEGTTMYSPKKEHQWNSHSRNEKGKMICGPECRLLPMNEEVIREHLSGTKTVGVYPLLQDETSWFLAVDFDENEWDKDAVAFLETCDKANVPAYLERSRSGTGAHIWIFFAKSIRASLARSLGTFLLSETKQNRFQIGFKSYDRMFPNQDTMPRGGYGNLIALPLQAEPRKSGNSVFIDRDLQPIEDQWLYLSKVQRMQEQEVEAIVREAASRQAIVTVPLSSDDPDTDEPWHRKTSTTKELSKLFKGQFPNQVEIVLSNMIYLPKDGFGSASLNKIMELAAFQNPEFYQRQATRQSTHDTPRIICCAENLLKHIALPRGCLEQLKDLLNANGISFEFRDERYEGNPIQAEFKGELRIEQRAAAEQLRTNEIGILCGSTAFGKTVVAIELISKRKTNTLILVNSLPLIDQWKERLQQFLDLAPKSIGQIGGGKKKRTGMIDVATIQSLVRKGVVSDVVSEYGQIIVDECHHISAFSFEQCAKSSKAKYVLGLTATPVRKDGHHPIITMQCGPIRFKDSHGNRKLVSGIKHEVISRETGFQFDLTLSNAPDFHELYKALAIDEKRNELIFDDILKELDQGRSPLVITQRVEHLELLASKLEGFAKNVIVLKGGMSRKEQKAAFLKLKSIPGTTERIILATGQYIGEGFDDARLDTLFLLLPISFEGKVAQYAGRLHREYEGKTDIRIYDYVDSRHPMFRKMFEKRKAKYKNLGYELVSR